MNKKLTSNRLGSVDIVEEVVGGILKAFKEEIEYSANNLYNFNFMFSNFNSQFSGSITL